MPILFIIMLVLLFVASYMVVDSLRSAPSSRRTATSTAQRSFNTHHKNFLALLPRQHHGSQQWSRIHTTLPLLSSLLGIDANDSKGESLSLSGPGVKSALESFFQLVDERRIQEIDELLETYKDKEKVLLAGLEKMYSQPVMQYDISKLDGAAQGPHESNDEDGGERSPAKKFDWLDAWYPVAFPKFLDKSTPTAVSILNRPYVLYFDHVKDVWALADDLCPHRLAPLSEGRVDDNGCIECPYHGWSFDGKSGQCTKIPQIANTSSTQLSYLSNPAYSIATYPIVERQGLLFMYPQPISQVGELPHEDAIPLCEPLHDPDVVCLDVSRDLPYDFSTLLENILDPSHVPFTHHGTIGNRNWANEVPLLIKGAATIDGFSGTYQFVPTSGPMTRTTDGSQIERFSQFKAPVYSVTSISRKDLQSWTVVYAVPSSPGQTRIIGRFPFKFKSVDEKAKRKFNLQKFVFKVIPNWLQHIQQNTVLDDDNIFLKLQEERAQAMGADWRKYLLPTRADLFVCQYRLWLEKFGHPFAEFYSKYKLTPISSSGSKPSQLSASSEENQNQQVTSDNNSKKARLSSFNFKDIKHSPFDPMSARLGLLDRYSQHVLQCKPCADALRNFQLLKRFAVVGLVLAASPLVSLFASLLSQVGLRGVVQTVQAKLPWKPLAGLLSLASIATWVLSDGFETKLTRGSWPAPRNQLTIRSKANKA